MRRIAFAAAVACLFLVPKATFAGDFTVKIVAPDNGSLRVQRMEGPFVMSDAFAGVVGDAISLQPGTYRLQTVYSNGYRLKMLYFEIDVSNDGGVSLASSSSPVSSIPYRDQAAEVAHIEPMLTKEKGFTLVDLGSSMQAAARTITLPPPLRATNWATDLSKLRSIAVSLKSEPEDAEIWVDGEQMELRTDASFAIPVESRKLLSPVDILVRKEGYANRILQISTEESKQAFNVVLTKQ
ncbi:hypothetical protein NKH95_24725 [Mesorhizobium sp. M0848]|uniref:hypothetical protein n=1 Tax=Mesorhizobium sp. M0848 TaxID=2957012 RepID=UPI00333766FA